MPLILVDLLKKKNKTDMMLRSMRSKVKYLVLLA